MRSLIRSLLACGFLLEKRCFLRCSLAADGPTKRVDKQRTRSKNIRYLAWQLLLVVVVILQKLVVVLLLLVLVLVAGCWWW
jgi:hypothetical protein